MWGLCGTGKTVVSVETVKIKVSHCKEKKKSVRVIVTHFGGRKGLLLSNIKEYLKNMENIGVQVQILSLKQLCENLGCPWNMFQPKATINAVIRSLSSDKSHQVTIFVCDELESCREDGQTTSDWRDVVTVDNVEWILSIRPTSDSRETINLKPPVSPVVTRKLLHRHRNSSQIRYILYKS